MNIDANEEALFQGGEDFQIAVTKLEETPEPSDSLTDLPNPKQKRLRDPGIGILPFASSRPGLEEDCILTPSSSTASSATFSPMDTAAGFESAGDTSVVHDPGSEQRQESENEQLAKRALKASESVGQSIEGSAAAKVPPSTRRVDSAQSASLSAAGDSRPPSRSLLRLQTSTSVPESHAGADDTIAASPTLSKHVIPAPSGTHDILPAVRPTSPLHERDAPGSPTSTTTLPSFQQFTGHLNELAEAAATQGPRPSQPSPAHHRTQSFASTTAPSPQLPYHIFSGSAQTSPASQYAYSAAARSPTSTIGEMPVHTVYGSPTQGYTGAAYFNDRRRSSALGEAPGPYSIPSLPSASSSGESHGAASANEGYSTAHTTPIDSTNLQDGTPRPPMQPLQPLQPVQQMQMPILPPPPGMPQSAVVMSAGFRCDQAGCTAPPFQTQYLLRSVYFVYRGPALRAPLLTYRPAPTKTSTALRGHISVQSRSVRAVRAAKASNARTR
jgi:hypothetical protein